METNSVKCIEYSKCLSCKSCYFSCPKSAIEMVENEEGFFYPHVNEECINCGVCKKKCPILSLLENKIVNQKCFGIYLKDQNKLLESSSGGAFAGIAEYILSQNGVVFGASYDENLSVKHICIESVDELKKIKGSKYVESDLNNTFVEVKNFCEQGKTVLFSGCPCQIAGLKKYLGTDFANLFTVDLICHGVPSRKLFSKYIEWLSSKTKGNIIYYGFRDKDVAGWSCGGKAKTKTKTKTIEASCDPYYASFLRGETYRESCYTCKFANMDRVGDITIGDFWGVEKYYPEINRENGISCCIVNTIKGESLVEAIKETFNIFECTEAEIRDSNTNLNHPTVRGKIRNNIYKGINELKAEKFFVRFKCENFLYIKIKRSVRKFIPRPIKKFIKKVLNRG